MEHRKLSFSEAIDVFIRVIEDWRHFFVLSSQNALRATEETRLKLNQMERDDENYLPVALMLQRYKTSADAFEYIAGELADLFSSLRGIFPLGHSTEYSTDSLQKVGKALALITSTVTRFLDAENKAAILSLKGLNESELSGIAADILSRIDRCVRAESSQRYVAFEHARMNLHAVRWAFTFNVFGTPGNPA